jgi:alkylhydroperoxidase/carboxymuconolactone decarboxylase family protein YurZ
MKHIAERTTRLTKLPLFIAAIASAVFATACSEPSGDANSTATRVESVESVSPALQRYGDEVLENQLWERPDLSPRQRSIVTVAAMIAQNQSLELPVYLNRALDNDVTPGELSEIITHLAFYSGHLNIAMDKGLTQAQASEVLTQLAFYADWPKVFSAMAVFKEVFEARR